MSFYTPDQVRHAAVWERKQIAEEIGRAEGFHQWHEKQRAEVQAQLTAALGDLSSSLLPTLTAASLTRAITLTGFAPLAHEDVLGKMTAEKTQLQGKLTAIDGDQAYVQRELLRHPRVGSLPRAMQELTGYRKPWADMLERAEHPKLYHLLECGFGTPQYQGPWWRLSTYSDKNASKEICAQLSVATFEEVRAEWLKARDTLQKLDAELLRVKEQLTYGENLEAERGRLAEALGTLDTRWLAWVRDRLIRHVTTADVAMLGQRFEREPDMKMLFLRASGLGHKLSYMDGLFQERVGKMVEDLRARDGKMAKIEQRSGNKAVAMPVPVFQKTFQDRREKYHKHWQRYSGNYDRVYRYDRWNHGRMQDDFLWWDLFTDGRVDGGFLPEVSHFRQRHPGYVYTRPSRRREEEDAAAESTDVDGTVDREDAPMRDAS